MRAALPARLPLRHLRRALSASAALTESELAAINRLVPRLLDSNHLHEAIRLTTTALLAAPPPSSLPLPALLDRLAAHPGLGPAFSLLAALRPRPSAALDVAPALLSSLLSRRRHKDAAKLLSWLRRPDSPHHPDRDLYAAAIRGLCGIGRPLEALKALGEMAEDGMLPGSETRTAVYRGLLMEARISEARELDAALELAEQDSSAIGGVKDLVDRMIKNWEE